MAAESWEKPSPGSMVPRCLSNGASFTSCRVLADKCRADLKGDTSKETRKQLMDQASAIYQAENAEEAGQRLAIFTQTWQEQSPKAVATCARDFEQTLAYYRLDGVARELIRTTSLLERTNRESRRKFRQVCCFGSPTGAEVSIFLQVKRLNACWSQQTWWEASHSLSFAFLDLDP
jgi:transposase-like protein